MQLARCRYEYHRRNEHRNPGRILLVQQPVAKYVVFKQRHSHYGPGSGVRITGAACNNSVTIADNGEPQNKYQKYGIYVSNGAASVRINACDLTGNLTNSLVVDGSQAQGAPSDIFVGHTDCTGVSAAVDVIPSCG